MRTTALEALEALEATHGHLHTVADWRITCEKSAAELTDTDLAILDHFDGAKAAATARDARMKALAVPVLEPATPVPSTPAARLPTISDADDLGTIEGLDRWAEENALAAVPIMVWRAFVKAQREKREQLEQRVGELEARLRELAAQPLPKYCGVFQDGASYVAGSLITRKGGLWLALEPTTETPGAGSTQWRLIVKEGAAR
ncbi:MAG: hypothetical protein M3545_18000 [Acidobacteriota bacterium]|nr:hypothetical protein [Acidobacteriota bacterium]